ncbi:Hypothetical protein, putative [Bodo saltans]|uniref:Uncharacterized protein n=1 Tax=Bodo saltans TaxID=75058 RepID=A0A0S4JMZ1_BODSA|nr:Hypothetical protein, putative [Bodo saltans]|eukprot:CUG91581.1 Hypothetical protein, putative [Bodo saltans]
MDYRWRRQVEDGGNKMSNEAIFPIHTKTLAMRPAASGGSATSFLWFASSSHTANSMNPSLCASSLMCSPSTAKEYYIASSWDDFCSSTRTTRRSALSLLYCICHTRDKKG